MDILQQIKQAEMEGWHLCVGCVHYINKDDEPCQTCPIETRKQMGYQDVACRYLSLDRFKKVNNG